MPLAPALVTLFVDVMADPVIMAANERLKSISRTSMQLGSALLAATVVRIYADQSFAVETTGWLIVAAAPIWVGWKMLMGLESET